MKRRVLSLILVLSMLMSIMAPAITMAAENDDLQSEVTAQSQEPQKNPFSDVNEDNWYYDAVMYSLQNGIFGGTGENSFSPDGTMTRGMYVTVMGRIAGVNPSDYIGNSGFDDVNQSDYYSPYVAWAAEKGISNGTSKNSFSPSSFVTREEMAALTVNFFDAYGIKYPEVTVKTEPGDLESIASWAKESVMKLWSCGMLQGDSNGNFLPKANGTRAEAAAFSMRTHGEVKKWRETGDSNTENSEENGKSEGSQENPKSQEPQKQSNTGGSNEKSNYPVAFNTNGGSPIGAVYIEGGKTLSDVPSPKKDNSIFLGWYTDKGLKEKFYAENPIKEGITLYAKYAELASQERFADESFSLINQSSDLYFDLSSVEDLTADGVKNKISLEIIDNSEYVNLVVTGKDGEFRVKAENGFNEGSSYKLNLNDDGITFANKSNSFRNCTFTIAKEEVIEITLNEDMVYIKSNNISNIKSDGESVDSLSVALIGKIEDIDREQNPKNITGTFTYEDAGKLKKDDILCVYDNTRPMDRNLQDDYSGDSISYVKVTNINGTTVTFQNVDSEEVLFLPDTLPLKEIDLSSYDATGSFTENTSELDFSIYSEIGLDESTTVDKGDYIVVSEADDDVVYGKITNVTEDNGITTVLFTVTTMEEIMNTTLDYYTEDNISGSTMLGDADIEKLQAQLEKQARDSGFAEQALVYLGRAAIRTEGFSNIASVDDFIMRDKEGNVIKPGTLSRRALDFDYSNDDIKVEVLIDNKTEHFGDGIKCVVKVSGDIAVDAGDDGEIIIGLSASFKEEIKVSINTKGKVIWRKTDWWPHLPYIGDYQMNANIDMYNYTGVSLKATLSSSEKEEEGKINFSDITDQLKALMENEDGEDITAGVQDLFEAYGEMLDNETDYITIVNKNIMESEASDPFHIFCVAIKTNFVVRANINMALGSNFEYECGNRYSFWFKVKEKTAGNSSMQLIDEKYSLQFYAMGELGLKVGVEIEIAAGLFSTKLDSVGIVAEVGPYLELFGYFFYELNSIKAPGSSAEIDTKMAGALYLEFGAYLIVSFKAQVGDGLLEKMATLYENQWPILYAGEEINVYDFAYEQPEADEKMIIKDYTTYTLPESIRNMSCLNLTEGDLFQDIYGTDRFYYTLSNPNFELKDNKITVTVPENVRYMECDLDVTWNKAKLTFSKEDLNRKIHLVWTDLTSIEMTQEYNISVKAAGNTIWSKTVKKGETPVLPTTEEVLKLINYNKYMDGETNLKYSGYTGYDSEAIPAQGNKTYNFGVTEKEYTLVVRDVESSKGKKTDETFTAKIGETFDLSSLMESGTKIKSNSVENTKYTKYLTTESNKVGEKTGKPVDSVVDGIFAKELLAGTYIYTAKYEDNSCLVTYKFNTPANDKIDAVTEKIEKGTSPTFDYSEYLLSKGGFYMVKGWDKTIGKVMVNTIFTATLGEPDGEQLTITFNGNGGSEVAPMKRYQYAAITAPAEPTREGYGFAGWYSDEALQIPYVFDKMTGESFTLYGKWNAREYIVTFNENGGNCATKTKSVIYDQTYGELPIGTKDSSGFDGWHTAVVNGDRVTSETKVLITAPQTLFAHWKLKENVSGINQGIQTTTYDGTGKEFAIKGTDLTGFTVRYKKAGDPDWSDKAINAGKYSVQIIRPADETYNACEFVWNEVFVVEKASRTISSPTGGTAYYATITVDPVKDFMGYGDGAVEYAVSTTGAASSALVWSTSLSTVNLYAKGDYHLYSRVLEGKNYLATTNSAASVVTVKVENPLELVDRNWTVDVKTADKSGAGTGAKIELLFDYIIGGYGDWQNLGCNGDNYERDDLTTSHLTEKDDPWMVKGINIGNDGHGAASDWKCSYIDFTIGSFGPVRVNVDRWFDNEREDYATYGFKRNITSVGEFETWGGTYDISSESTGNLEYSFDGNITDQYGTYNVYAHYDAPLISVNPSKDGYSDCFSYKVNSFSIDKEELYKKMSENNEDSLEFTITLKFDSRSTNTTEFTKTVTINRL